MLIWNISTEALAQGLKEGGRRNNGGGTERVSNGQVFLPNFAKDITK